MWDVPFQVFVLQHLIDRRSQRMASRRVDFEYPSRRFAVLSSLVVAAALGAPPDTVPIASTPPPARYFFILYGGQSLPFKPRTAHTWATFVKTAPDPGGVLNVEMFTISWLPVTGEVKPCRLRPEAGRNYSLEET